MTNRNRAHKGSNPYKRWVMWAALVLLVLLTAKYTDYFHGESGDTGEIAGPYQVTLERVIDGDTVITSEGKVRLIGIDTPEREECGYEEAKTAVLDLISPGDPVTLILPDGQNNTDHHDRLLRYVVTEDGVDLGMMQIEEGHAVARYDSRHGYPHHPNEDAYHQAQTAQLKDRKTVVPPYCEGR